MTPQDIITEARYILNDTDTVAPRNTDPELLGYVNDALRECVELNPPLFSTVVTFPCVAGQCEQTLTYADAAGLIEVLCIHNSTALTMFDMKALDAFHPDWRTDTAAPARQWSRYPNDRLRFFIYPKPPVDQSVDVRYAKTPGVYALTDPITEVPSTLLSAFADYVVYRAELKDDEHVLSQRAAASYASFTTKVKG